MKIYTSEIAQFGKELKILNEKVSFDKIGCAEVEDDFGKKMLEYSPWYSATKHEPLKPVVKKTEENNLSDAIIENLKLEIEKLNKKDDAKTSRIKSLETENNEIRSDMGKVVLDRDELKKLMEDKEQIWTKEKEQLDYKFELSLMDLEELKEMCSKLEIEEKEYKNKRSKKSIIEMIINAAQ